MNKGYCSVSEVLPLGFIADFKLYATWCSNKLWDLESDRPRLNSVFNISASPFHHQHVISMSVDFVLALIWPRTLLRSVFHWQYVDYMEGVVIKYRRNYCTHFPLTSPWPLLLPQLPHAHPSPLRWILTSETF